MPLKRINTLTTLGDHPDSGIVMKSLRNRLSMADPGWSEWSSLLSLMDSLVFEYHSCEYLGNFYRSGERLCFSEWRHDFDLPEWLPLYVPALYGMKADDWQMAGGYCDSFCCEPPQSGGVFSPAGNDLQLGYPLISVPLDTYAFQSNSSGARFFINQTLDILYPSAENKRFERLDSLDDFTKKNIQQVLIGKSWFDAYAGETRSLID